MARLRAWLTSHLLIILVNTTTSLAYTGSPNTPSIPECSIPYAISEASDIHCFWEAEPDQYPGVPTSYSLHWVHATEQDPKIYSYRVERGQGVIPREQYLPHSDLMVWVKAENQYSTVESDKATFRTDEIRVPSSPNISSLTRDPLEVTWTSGCSQLGLSEKDCEVHYRTQGQQDWSKVEENLQNSYELLDPLPYTMYEFQVRCDCEGLTVKSRWTSQSVQSAEAAPQGEVDVWSDCGIHSDFSQCALVWKKPTPSVARGEVLGYLVSYSNGLKNCPNVSVTDLGSQCDFKGDKCSLRFPLLGVSKVDLSAYTSKGTTKPASLALPTPALRSQGQNLVCKMNEVSLVVSWPSQLTDNLQELVVQYKQVGLPPSQGFDWMKLNNSQTSTMFTGAFENYTLYNVSLFGVSGNVSFLLSWATAYACEGIPPKVPFVKILDISDSEVTLIWGHIPQNQSKGQIQFYLLELGNQTVNMSVKEQLHLWNSYVFKDLSPGKSYKVGIRAVTKAGSGQATTIYFDTKAMEGYGSQFYLVLLIIPIIVVLVLAWFVIQKSRFSKVLAWCDQVPDPSNSRLFQQLKSKGDSTFICYPLEPTPKISQLKVIQIWPQDIKAFPGKTDCLPDKVNGEEHIEEGTEEEEGKGEDADLESGWIQIKKGGIEEQDYSTMIDTDEERDRGDMADSPYLSEEEEFLSGYEKHFMPTAIE